MRRMCLCLMMAFLAALCLNGTASAELVLVSQGEILDEGPCGENLTWTLYSDGTLVISGTGPSYDFVKGILQGYTAEDLALYVEKHPDHPDYGMREGGVYHEYTANDGIYIGYAAPWYRYRAETDFTSYTSHEKYDKFNPKGWTFNRIVIEEGVTYIGDWMFYRLCGPTELVIPEGVTSLGRYAIRYSTTLETIILPDTLISIGDYGVSRHENTLTSLSLGNSVQELGECVMQANKVQKQIIFPASLTSVGNFTCNGNTGLLYADLGQLDAISINMFTFCSSLREVKMSEYVVQIGQSAFYKCASLESIRIPATCEKIGNGAFMYCDNLKTVYIDSPVIAAGCTVRGKYGSLLNNCETLYIHTSITTVGKQIETEYAQGPQIGDYIIYTRIATE